MSAEYKKAYYEKNKHKWKEYGKKQKENKKQYYLNNKDRLLEKQKEYSKNNKEKIYEYRQSEAGIKSHQITSWKRMNLKGDYEKIYERYKNTTHCDLCKVELTLDKKITSTRKCMEHNHETGEFRNITCHKCNMSRKGNYKNNTTGHKGIYKVNDEGRIRFRHKSKRFKTLEEAIEYKKGNYKNNTTGHKGIYKVNDEGRIRFRHKSKRFKTLEEAIEYKKSLE